VPRGDDVPLVVGRAHGALAQQEAASVWARAVSRRDALPVQARAQEKLPGIRSARAGPGASLHLARRGERVVGFCVLVPSGERLEVRYLATDPDAWGSGVGRALLTHVDAHLGAAGGELWVLTDNPRAVAAYEGAGRVGTDDVEERATPGRPERRFVRDVREVHMTRRSTCASGKYSGRTGT
jgi:ribosomal protein S18 acetylase RimI-like enzyme